MMCSGATSLLNVGRGCSDRHLAMAINMADDSAQQLVEQSKVTGDNRRVSSGLVGCHGIHEIKSLGFWHVALIVAKYPYPSASSFGFWSKLSVVRVAVASGGFRASRNLDMPQDAGHHGEPGSESRSE
jgi:hypothetical protein